MTSLGLCSLSIAILLLAALSAVNTSPLGYLTYTKTRGQTIKTFYWTDWTQCSHRCSSGDTRVSGIRIRRKMCHLTSDRCHGDISNSCYRKCDEIMIPCYAECVHSVFADAEWNACNSTCDEGHRWRTSVRTQQVEVIRCNTHDCTKPDEKCSADIAFVLDASGSITEKNWWTAKQFIIDVVGGLDVGLHFTRVSLVTFSDGARVLFDLNQYQSRHGVAGHIWVAPYLGGYTRTSAGIMEMRKMMVEKRRPKMKQLAVIITDGMSNKDEKRTIPEAEIAKKLGIKILVIGITNETNYEDLKEISSGEDYMFHVSNYDSLQTITNLIRKRTCQIIKNEDKTTTKNDQLTTDEKTTTQIKVLSTTKKADKSTTQSTTKYVTEGPYPGVDCSRCDFSKGLIWRPDAVSCHVYYVCDPQPNNKYRITKMTCYHLYWNQDLHTCVAKLPENYTCNPLVTPIVTSTIVTSHDPRSTPMYCPFEVNPDNRREFRPKNSAGAYQTCKLKFYFSLRVCTCMPTSAPPVPKCNSDFLLRFPFDEHLDDVMCTRARSDYGLGEVILTSDTSVTVGKVARFQNSYLEIPYLRGHFNGDWVSAFSLTAFFKSTASHGGTKEEVLLANSDCKNMGNIRVTYLPSSGLLTASINTISSGWTSVTYEMAAVGSSWHHIAWVFAAEELSLYVDGKLTTSAPATGNMANNGISMKIGGCCMNDVTFTGLMDEVRFYSRGLTSTEVKVISKERSYSS